MINEVVAHYRKAQVDPGYRSTYEKAYTEAFVKFMGGGYADAVATGTAALFVAVAALDLPPGSEVIVSPITDPGTLSAIILDRLVPRVADSGPARSTSGAKQFAARITRRTPARWILVRRSAAPPMSIGVINEAHARGIKVVENCSQSRGTRIRGRPVGNFGGRRVLTMYRKARMTGGPAASSVSATSMYVAGAGGRAAARQSRRRAGRFSTTAIPMDSCYPALQYSHRRNLLCDWRSVTSAR